MFIDIASRNMEKDKQLVCGDVFLSKRVKEENRLVAVLSDGLGSGIKANVLATMTANMALNFILADQPVERSAESIRNTLPVDSDRMISYASFTIVDTEFDGTSRIIEYGNPQSMVFRGSRLLETSKDKLGDGEINISNFKAVLDDRIILFSDGVSQSGMGMSSMPFGWEMSLMKKFLESLIFSNPSISAEQLCSKIMARALLNDGYKPKDDISCSVIHFREARQLLICTGPPYKKDKDSIMADIVESFSGKKVLCGGTTAIILSRELGREVETDLENMDSTLPPCSNMEGIDLITEGILTLGKVAESLSIETWKELGKYNSAKLLLELIMSHDKITFLVGTSVNGAHQDPSLPVELDIRRNVIKKIALLLENKYLKETEINYI
jgi:stage II sporulation SpoE-like protein